MATTMFSEAPCRAELIQVRTHSLSAANTGWKESLSPMTECISVIWWCPLTSSLGIICCAKLLFAFFSVLSGLIVMA